MNITPTLGEIRPSHTTGDPYAEPFTLPLLRLRGHDRRVILPEACLVPGCLVCQWRRQGLLDASAPPAARATVVRESAGAYGLCRSSLCPGCGHVACVCPPDGFEDALAEASYALGTDHGEADGADNRPSVAWCLDAGLDAESYLAGYDDACAGLPLHAPETARAEGVRPQLYDDIDDGLPF